MVRVTPTNSGAVIHNSHPRQADGERARHSVSRCGWGSNRYKSTLHSPILNRQVLSVGMEDQWRRRSIGLGGGAPRPGAVLAIARTIGSKLGLPR